MKKGTEIKYLGKRGILKSVNSDGTLNIKYINNTGNWVTANFVNKTTVVIL